MKLSVVVTALALAACSSPAKDAEDQYNIVTKAADLDTRCTAAKRVAEEYLKAKDAENYQVWRVRAAADCANAENRRWPR